MASTKNGIDMENHVFQKARNKDEYLGFVARLILHVREMSEYASGGNTVIFCLIAEIPFYQKIRIHRMRAVMGMLDKALVVLLVLEGQVCPIQLMPSKIWPVKARAIPK
jgi:hypothetical protein